MPGWLAAGCCLAAACLAAAWQIGGLSNEELAAAFTEWNKGELDSFLISITSAIFTVKDAPESGGGFVVDKILDKTGMKGTGRWTIQEAAER